MPSANVVLPVGVNRTSQIVTTIIPAGQQISIFQAGARFYLIVATGLLSVKPNNGSENNYVQGTGLECDELNFFANIKVVNPNSFNVVLQIFVGFGNYIDNRLIVYDPTVIQAVYSTYGVANSINDVLIPDKSGQAIVAADGTRYLALNRVSLSVFNLDTGVTLGVSTPSSLTNVLALIFPQTGIILNWSGNFRVKVPAAFVNGVISEVYNAILPT